VAPNIARAADDEYIQFSLLYCWRSYKTLVLVGPNVKSAGDCRAYWPCETADIRAILYFSPEFGRISFLCATRKERSAPETGLYACIFFAFGKKGYRSNPLRCCKTASLPFYSFEFLLRKTHESPQPASLPACLRQTPSIRHWRIAMKTAASMPQDGPRTGL
jgi:hypothetical protein